ncbi:MAG: GntR family transcriptional regulator [Burkholderiales bacterium]|nr:GntR family transcriptional regulator [Burkholderiales bacterium]
MQDLHRPPPLHELAAAQLRAMLVEGRIEPGARLNERQLALTLRVSPTPLREAMSQLAAEGLLDLLPSRAAFAIKLGEDEIRHSFEMLAILESQAGALAAQRIDDDARDALLALQRELRGAHGRGDLAAYCRVDAQIHAAIGAAAANPLLVDAQRALAGRVQHLRWRALQDAAAWRRSLAEHEAMTAALAARDGAALGALLRAHLERKRDGLLAQMRAQACQING